jgi:predicted nucleic acid-binding protein
LRLGQSILLEEVLEIVWITPADVRRAWEVFRAYRDKAWSFTDCVSFVVMERLGLRTAFAFDQHFRQFGIVTVVP